MLEGTMSRPDKCQPAWSTRRAACAPGAIWVAISARWRFIASGVASWQDERRALAVLGTDRAEDIGGGGSLVFRGARARAALGPAARDPVLLADARLVCKPDFYGGGLDAFFMPDLRQALREAF